MKNVLVTACMFLLVTAGKVSGQQASYATIPDNLKWMNIHGGYPNNVNTRAVRDFLKRNKNGLEADWNVIDNGYVVKYAEKGKQCRTVYSKKGVYLYTIRQYSEEQMPRDVRALIKSRYYDHTITLVEEIERPVKPLSYVIHLQDATTIINVQVCEGAIEVVEDFIRG